MKKKNTIVLVLTLISILVLSSISTLAIKKNNEAILYPVQVNGKWGYINKAGSIVVKPQYSNADDFYNGAAIVQIKVKPNNNKFVYDGNDVKYGVIDNTGKLIIKTNFVYISKFNENVAYAITENSKSKILVGCIIDKSGKILFKLPQNLKVGPLIVYGKDFPVQSQGMILVQDINTELFGYLDATGKWIKHTKYEEGYPYSDGLALVKYNTKYQYINKAGKTIIDASKYSICRPFSEGLAAVSVQKTERSPINYGYIDTKGRMKIKPQFARAFRFSEGLAKVCTGQSINQYSIGYIDTSGKYKINPTLKDHINEIFFSEGMAPIDDGAVGYVDKSGKLIIGAVVLKDDSNILKHNVAGNFKNGIAKVTMIDGKVGYINTTGRFIWNVRK